MMELERYNFIENDYHTIRRTNKFWAGLWSDVIIEQGIIRGGITRRHEVIESVEVLRTYTTQCGAMHEAMTNLTGMKHKPSVAL